MTSNYQSGVISDLRRHPLPDMLERGLNATIHTDDPSVSRITLSHEYRVAHEELGLSLETIKACVLAAGQAAFLSDTERLGLTTRLKKELKLPSSAD